MKLIKTQLIFLCLILGIGLKAQDQVVYIGGDKEYVDKIDDVNNDSITYTHYKKTSKVPLSKIKGYYLTIDTKENLKKRYYKREREYHEVDSSYHGAYYSNDKFHRDVISDYIQSCLPNNFSTLKYKNGYYINYNSDTIRTLISDFNDLEKNGVLFITKSDSADYEIFTPLLVQEYSINNQVYISYFPTKEDEEKEIYLFIKKEIAGKINLFNKPSLPYHEGSYYLVNVNNSDIFYHLCPYSICNFKGVTGYQKIMITGPYGSTNYYYAATNPTLDNSFNKLMPQLVSDCPGLVNRIKSEFYTKADIKLIIEKYNQGCQ